MENGYHFQPLQMVIFENQVELSQEMINLKQAEAEKRRSAVKKKHEIIVTMQCFQCTFYPIISHFFVPDPIIPLFPIFSSS